MWQTKKMKNYSNKKQIFLAMIFIIISEIITYGGMIEEKDGIIKYKTKNGEYAKNTWVWLDINNDGIEECYRFDNDGKVAKNYKDRYGRETNEKGQFIEHNEIIKRISSTGKVLNKTQTPEKFLVKNETRKVEEKKGPEAEAINNKIIYEKEKELGIEGEKNKIIYTADINKEEVKENEEIIIGKNIKNFIVNKNKCDKKVEDVYIYGGEKWNEAISLNGDEAMIEIDMQGNNHIYFEVANESHNEEEIGMELLMYVDGELMNRYDDFVLGDKEIVEEIIEGEKVELRVEISSGKIGRKTYIRNGRIRKIKTED